MTLRCKIPIDLVSRTAAVAQKGAVKLVFSSTDCGETFGVIYMNVFVFCLEGTKCNFMWTVVLPILSVGLAVFVYIFMLFYNLL